MENNPTNSIEMLVSMKSMQAIVENISALILHDVVICNRQGVIISASQMSRIGLSNTNVREMIENESEIHIIASETTDSSFRAGVNLPIRLEGTIVGAVGITGEPAEVQSFCSIVQAFIEHQLVSLIQERSRSIQQQNLNNFVYSWIFRDLYQDSEEFEFHRKSLNIDITVPRVVAIIDYSDASCIKKQPERFYSNIQWYIERELKNHSRTHVVARIGNELVVMLNVSSNTQALHLMENIRKNVLRSYNFRCAIGIGSLFQSPSEAKMSYEAAKHACITSKESPDKEIFVFDLYDWELILSALDRRYRQRIYNHTFQNFKSEEQIEESITLLQTYINCNRSISQTGETLFLHKNTIQQRLTRIFDLTGYDPRQAKDLAYLYLVTLLHKTGIRLDIPTQ